MNLQKCRSKRKMYSLGIGDKIDYRGDDGKFRYCTIYGTCFNRLMVMHSDGYDEISLETDDHRFAVAGSISRKSAKRFKNHGFRNSDVVRINPMMRHHHIGWCIGTIIESDTKSGQVYVGYMHQGRNYGYWVHIDDPNEFELCHPDELKLRADQAFKDEEYLKAIQLYTQAIDSEPDNHTLYERTGDAYDMVHYNRNKMPEMKSEIDDNNDILIFECKDCRKGKCDEKEDNGVEGKLKLYYDRKNDLTKITFCNEHRIDDRIGSQGHTFKPYQDSWGKTRLRQCYYQHISVGYIDDRFTNKSPEEIRFEDKFGDAAVCSDCIWPTDETATKLLITIMNNFKDSDDNNLTGVWICDEDRKFVFYEDFISRHVIGFMQLRDKTVSHIHGKRKGYENKYKLTETYELTKTMNRIVDINIEFLSDNKQIKLTHIPSYAIKEWNLTLTNQHIPYNLYQELVCNVFMPS